MAFEIVMPHIFFVDKILRLLLHTDKTISRKQLVLHVGPTWLNIRNNDHMHAYPMIPIVFFLLFKQY